MSGAAGLVLAFDFGLRRIGVASANRLTRTATPLTTLKINDDVPWPEIDQLVRDWRPSMLVVGMPPSGGDTPIIAAINGFVAELKRRYPIDVATVDESLTSQAAASALRDKRRSGFLRRRLSKGSVDRHAACLIAEQWMSATA